MRAERPIQFFTHFLLNLSFYKDFSFPGFLFSYEQANIIFSPTDLFTILEFQNHEIG